MYLSQAMLRETSPEEDILPQLWNLVLLGACLMLEGSVVPCRAVWPESRDDPAAQQVSSAMAPVEWICQLCQDILLEPLTLPCCGESFCKTCLQQLSHSRVSFCTLLRVP